MTDVVLTLPPGAPTGGLEGCSGLLVLDINRNDCGSWSKACSVELTINCEARGCWWSRMVEGPITAETFRVAKQQHDADTLWPSDGSAPWPGGASDLNGNRIAHSDSCASASPIRTTAAIPQPPDSGDQCTVPGATP